MLRPRPFVFAFPLFLSLAGLAMGETRFGRPVVKLSNPKDFEFVDLEDNRFPVLRKNEISIACITYREHQRYYVEVAVTNQSGAAVELTKDFVQFLPNSNVVSLDTLAVAADIQKSAAAAVQAQGLSASRASNISSGTVSGNDDRRQPILESIAHSEQVRDNQLVARLATFAHETQNRIIEPGKTRFYVFVFEQQDRKKAPFGISVTAEAETLVFPYKE